MRVGRVATRVAGPLVVLGLVGVLAYGLTRDPRAIPSPLIGRPAPDITLPRFDGGTFLLTEARGQIVIVNFWASWCYPACYEEAPHLEETWRSMRDRGVIVLGVNIQDTEKNAREFLRSMGITFPNVRDAKGAVAIDYGVYGVPETFVIGPDGRIAAKHVGAVTRQVLARAVTPLLASVTPAALPAAQATP